MLIPLLILQWFITSDWEQVSPYGWALDASSPGTYSIYGCTSEINGGTPGGVNSCSTIENLVPSTEDDIFLVYPTTISHDTNQTWVGFTLIEDEELEEISLKVFDLNGCVVKYIITEADERRWVWDIANDNDSYLTIGTYIVKLEYLKVDGTSKICRKLMCLAP